MPSESHQLQPRHSLHRQLVFFLGEWAAMLAAWMLLVDSTARAEVLLGLGVSLVAAATATWLQAANFARFGPHWNELIQAWRIPWYLLEDTVIAFHVLGSRLMGRRLHSVVRCVHFDAVADDPHSAARRALVTGLNTIPPNSIVIGIDRNRKQLVFHQLKRRPVPLMMKKLGAKP